MKNITTRNTASAFLLASFMTFVPALAFAQSNIKGDNDGCWSGKDTRGNSCLEFFDKEWSNDGQRLEVKMRNRCNANIYTRSCLQRKSKSPSCEQRSLKPRQTSTHYTWNATGAVHGKAIGSLKTSKDWVCSGKISNWKTTPW